jgi:hypothetical protein
MALEIIYTRTKQIPAREIIQNMKALMLYLFKIQGNSHTKGKGNLNLFVFDNKAI